MEQNTRLSRILSGISLGVGLWLLLSPILLTYQSFDALAQQVIIGMIVMLVAGVRMALPAVHWPSWVNVLVAAQLILIPLNTQLLSGPVHLNATITGLLLLALSLRSASRQQFLLPPTQMRHH